MFTKDTDDRLKGKILSQSNSWSLKLQQGRLKLWRLTVSLEGSRSSFFGIETDRDSMLPQ